MAVWRASKDDFNPLSRMGRDTAPPALRGRYRRFQSTLPAWGETQNTDQGDVRIKFQSTLPAWGET